MERLAILNVVVYDVGVCVAFFVVYDAVGGVAVFTITVEKGV
jgi:hypothetical protein